MAAPKLTPQQAAYKSRKIAADRLGNTTDEGGVTLAQLVADHSVTYEQLTELFPPDVLDAYSLAVHQLEEATRIMEDDAAFPHRVRQLRDQYPLEDRATTAQLCRRELSDPERRHELAVEAGVYELLKEAGA